jgi:hypothetical protein
VKGDDVMKTVLLRGPILTHSGYGIHSRQIARWLLTKRGIDLSVGALPWGNTPWCVDPTMDGGLIGRLMECTGVSQRVNDVTFQIQLPNEWDNSLGRFNVGVTAAVETDRCNPEWITACNRMNAVIVPSEHTRNVLRASGELRVPVTVIPESFADPCGRDDVTIDVDFDTSFNFLIFGQITGNNPHNDRKNLLFTVKWLCELFKNDPTVGIVVKTNSGRMTKIDKKVCTDIFTTALREVRSGVYPKLHLLHGMMTDETVAGLYRHPKIKALITCTRGEGYGLPILEAAASGLPVVATNWSGHLDFMKLGKFVNLDYDLKEIHASRVDGKIFMQGSKWAEVKEEDFKRRVKKFKESPVTPREWACDLKSKIRAEFSFESISRKWDAEFGEML